MKKLFNCFLLALLCLALPLASCSKDEPTSNENTENTENENENDNNISKDVVEVKADGKLVANGLIFEITSFTDNTAAVTGTSSEVNADNFTGGFEIPAYIKYQSQKYTVTTIGNKIFFEFKKMTSIKLPSKLVSIGDEAFSGCESLTSVTIPNSVTKIGERAFSKCSALKEIQLSKSLNEIGEYAFYSAKLEKVYVESTTPPTAEYSSFGATLVDGTLIVPKSAYNAYICTAPWCGFNNIYYDGLIEGEEIREAVNLGLSVKWASENIGARRHGSFGQYFAWGETEIKETYTVENSKWYRVGQSDLKAQGVIDSNGNLTAKYDAASVNWGGKWRMPTLDEIKELIDKCTWTWTAENGVNGYKVTGPNGNSIFLPAAGYRSGSVLGNAGACGYYWGPTAYSNSYGAYGLTFNSSNHYWYSSYRYYGQSVRPVAE